jgi:hypothetical protein
LKNQRRQVANGWSLYYYRTFKATLDELEVVVARLATDDPAGYKTHPKAKRPQAWNADYLTFAVREP